MFHVSSIAHVSRLASLVLPLATLALSSAAAVTSAQIGGLLEIDSGAVNTIVNVPWVGFAKDDTHPIDVAALVKTRNLVVGDTLMAVKPDGVYEAWSVDENGTWQPVKTLVKGKDGQTLAEPPAAGERTLACGLGLWLVRCGQGADLTKPFYVSGQYTASPGTATVAGVGSGASAWTLLANPDRTAVTKLNEIDWQGKPLAGDEIAVVKNDGAHQIFTWRKEQDGTWRWGTGGGWEKDGATGLMRQKARDTSAEVSAGAAIWYVRKGESFSFSW